MNLSLQSIPQPPLDHSGQTVERTDAMYQARLQKVLDLMKESGFSTLFIYADKEHGGNFEYLTGFIPRFEEGLQVLTQDGVSTLILGNENFNKVKYSRVASQGVKCPLLSLPNQPMNDFEPFETYLEAVKVDLSGRLGVVGWKLLTNDYEAVCQSYSVPEFILTGLQKAYGAEKLSNASQLYLHPEKGARTTNGANEIALYEFGASLASDAVLTAMNHLVEGQSEFEAGNYLTVNGQFPNVVPIAAFGERFVGANIYPTDRQLAYGDKVALTASYKGGLSSRTGYAVDAAEDLEAVDPGYLEEVVKPYYQAYLYWLDHVRLGVKGGDFYRDFSDFYPAATYGWELNPGHLTADEEWLSSPFYEGSEAVVRSGMIFQVDFIPIQPPHQGISAESTVAVADENLRADIQATYPELWERIQARRAYMKEYLKIDLAEELLPLCSGLAYMRPCLLSRDLALVKED